MHPQSASTDVDVQTQPLKSTIVRSRIKVSARMNNEGSDRVPGVIKFLLVLLLKPITRVVEEKHSSLFKLAVKKRLRETFLNTVRPRLSESGSILNPKERNLNKPRPNSVPH